MLNLNWGQRSSSAIMGAFLQTLFLFFLWSNNKMFFKLKKMSKSFRRPKLTCLLLKKPLEASFYGFYKDKHRKFCAIMTEILPNLG